MLTLWGRSAGRACRFSMPSWGRSPPPQPRGQTRSIRGGTRRGLGAIAVGEDLTSASAARSPAEDAGRTEPVTTEEAAALGASSLAIADGLTEEDSRERDPDVFRRVQARSLTQAERTQDRLNQFPSR